MKNFDPDVTIFTLRDQGEYSANVPAKELALSYDHAVDPAHFDEILATLHSLADHDWCGPITAYVEYMQLTVTGFEKRIKKQIEGYDPDKEKSGLSISIMGSGILIKEPE